MLSLKFSTSFPGFLACLSCLYKRVTDLFCWALWKIMYNPNRIMLLITTSQRTASRFFLFFKHPYVTRRRANGACLPGQQYPSRRTFPPWEMQTQNTEEQLGLGWIPSHGETSEFSSCHLIHLLWSFHRIPITYCGGSITDDKLWIFRLSFTPQRTNSDGCGSKFAQHFSHLKVQAQPGTGGGLVNIRSILLDVYGTNAAVL